MDNDSKPCSMCDQSQAAQKASLHSIPQTTAGHNNDEMTPIGSKAMTGANYG